MKRLLFIPLFVLILIPNLSFAEINGQALFKSKCNTCHIIDRNSTGPMLKGVSAKWEDAGESDLLYEWVKNPAELIASGKSAMALAIKNYSGSGMPAQQVSQEEIDAIFAYIDNWVPPKKKKQEVIASLDYSPYYSRLTMTYILGGMILLLLLSISVTSNTFIRLTQHGIQLKKIRTRKSSRRVVIISVLALLFLYSVAPGSVGITPLVKETPPWLMVEMYQLYILLGINIMLVFVLFRLKELLQLLYPNVQPTQVS